LPGWQHLGPQGRVLVAKGVSSLLQHRDELVDQRGPAPRADGLQAERGPGEPRRVGGSPGELRRLERGLPAAGQIAGPAAGGGQLEQELGPSPAAGPR
jgi:hypothetical protein